MSPDVRELTEQRENELLSPLAARSYGSGDRAKAEEPDPIRTAFQRDRDRILHTKAFRRLTHKTQVFIDPQGDHYRTRMTHTLEVAQIARTIGRALRLNEDLIEAISLGHDLGHPPFGHAGEAALDEVIRLDADRAAPVGFRHWEQSLRIVDVLEKLNLTQETREGIGGHSKGRNDLTAQDGERVSTLEAAVVRISDRIAYVNHDWDDAIRSGIIDQVPKRFRALGKTHSLRIGRMVADVVSHSLDRPAILMSDELREELNALKEWLFENVYTEYPVRFPDVRKGQRIVRDLYVVLREGGLPGGYKGKQGTVDYLAGMTDRFAIEAFVSAKLPSRVM